MSDEEKSTREKLEKAMVDAKRLLDKIDENVVGVLYAVCPHCEKTIEIEINSYKYGVIRLRFEDE